MNDKRNGDQPLCCEGGDCCQPGKAEGKKRTNCWKTVVFTGVILLACGVAAYSLFGRGRNAAGSSCCAAGSAACATPCEGRSSVAASDYQPGGADLALVLFLPEGKVLSQEGGAAVDAAQADLESAGLPVKILNIYSNDTAFAKTADRYKITDLPALLVTGGSVSVILREAEINKDTILRIYRENAKAIQVDSATQSRNGKTRDPSGMD